MRAARPRGAPTPSTSPGSSARVADCAAAADGGDPDRYYRENERLHAALYALSGNAFLEAEALALHHRLQAFRRLQLRVPRRVRESMAEHRGIVEALRAGDGALAADRARAHVAVQNERFGDLVAARAALGARRSAAR